MLRIVPNRASTLPPTGNHIIPTASRESVLSEAAEEMESSATPPSISIDRVIEQVKNATIQLHNFTNRGGSLIDKLAKDAQKTIDHFGVNLDKIEASLKDVEGAASGRWAETPNLPWVLILVICLLVCIIATLVLLILCGGEKIYLCVKTRQANQIAKKQQLQPGSDEQQDALNRRRRAVACCASILPRHYPTSARCFTASAFTRSALCLRHPC
uniref:Uncharacterized protein n=1 Tax=Plectus sambesii TaxID=2011161 RepID=A0A914US07_9BILA